MARERPELEVCVLMTVVPGCQTWLHFLQENTPVYNGTACKLICFFCDDCMEAYSNFICSTCGKGKDGFSVVKGLSRNSKLITRKRDLRSRSLACALYNVTRFTRKSQEVWLLASAEYCKN